MKKYCIITIFLFLLIIVYFPVLAYDSYLTHPLLTESAIQVYNRDFDNKISDQEKNWIIEGAINEDADPRYLNHFYDPVKNKGLKIMGIQYPTAKKWANFQLSASGAYSIKDILANYKSNNKKRAFIGIGHILHLIQDMSVPAHTRLDEHPEGDPYESWAKQWGRISNVNNIKAIKVGIDNSFDELANFSNNNFFSKDTIPNINTNKYKIFERKVGDKKEYYLTKDIDNYNVKILIITNPDSIVPEYSVKHLLVNSDYWKILSPKAIGYSAGVIKYFTDEFDEIDKNRDDVGWFKKGLNYVGNKAINIGNGFSYVYGDVYMKTKTVVEGTTHATANKVKEWTEFGGYFVDANKEIIVDTSKKTYNVSKKVGVEATEISKKATADTKEKVEEVFNDLEKKVLGVKEDNSAQRKTMIISDDKVEKQIDNKFVVKKNKGEKIKYVIDGDTFVLESGESVRYIGIDSPELNKKGADDDECLAWFARLRNMQLLGLGEIKLIKDPGFDKDKYGRLLRYVYAGDNFVNKTLVREGLAEAFFCEPYMKNCPVVKDEEKKAEIIKANNEALFEKRGIYSKVCTEDIKEEISNDIKKKAEKIITNSDNVVNFSAIFSGKGSVASIGQEQEAVINNNNDDLFNEDASSTTEIDTGSSTEDIFKEPEILQFRLYDLETSNEKYTSSSSVGVFLDILNGDNIEGYYFSESSSTPVASSTWLEFVPDRYLLTNREGYKNLYLWLIYDSVISSSSISSIIVDYSRPNIKIVERPDFYHNATSSIFVIELDEPAVLEYRLNKERLVTFEGDNDIKLEKGLNYIEFVATDLSGNIATTSAEVLVDTDAPTVEISDLNESYGKIDFLVEWRGFDPIINKKTNGSGISRYFLQYKIDENGWVNWDTLTATSSEINLSIDENCEINFRARAIDKAGNLGEWSEDVKTDIKIIKKLDHLVISEIATQGKGGAYDEYVELFNPTSDVINLKNWKLQSKSGEGRSWVNRTGSQGFSEVLIMPNEYFLVASDGYYAIDVIPDYRHLSNWGLDDENGHIRIINNQGEEVDKVGWGEAIDPETESISGEVIKDNTFHRKAVSSSTSESMSKNGLHFSVREKIDTNNNKNDFVMTEFTPTNSFSKYFKNVWYLNEGQGSHSIDVINNDDINISSAQWYLGSLFSSMYSLRLKNSRIDKKLAQEVNKENFTFSFWFRYDSEYSTSSPKNDGLYLMSGDGDVMSGINISSDHLCLYYDGEEINCDITGYNNGSWYYISIVYDDYFHKLYFNIFENNILTLDYYPIEGDITSLLIQSETKIFDLYKISILNKALSINQIQEQIKWDQCEISPFSCPGVGPPVLY